MRTFASIAALLSVVAAFAAHNDASEPALPTCSSNYTSATRFISWDERGRLLLRPLSELSAIMRQRLESYAALSCVENRYPDLIFTPHRGPDMTLYQPELYHYYALCCVPRDDVPPLYCEVYVVPADLTASYYRAFLHMACPSASPIYEASSQQNRRYISDEWFDQLRDDTTLDALEPTCDCYCDEEHLTRQQVYVVITSALLICVIALFSWCVGSIMTN